MHQSAWTWHEMRCGGRCNKCRFEHARSNEEFIDLMKPWVRKFSGMVSSGDVASGPSSGSGPRQVTWRPTPRVESVTTRVGEPVSLRPVVDLVRGFHLHHRDQVQEFQHQLHQQLHRLSQQWKLLQGRTSPQ